MKCAIITPIGPGHQQIVAQCRRSVEQAKLKPGPFSGIKHILINDTRGAMGRSRARNDGVRQAQTKGADWIFFLDADDLLTPFAFEAVKEHLAAYDAIWGNIAELSEQKDEARLRVPQIITLNSLSEVLLHDPFRTLQMGHFVRTAVAAQHPFNVDLNTGEDFDYYLRLWEHQRCVKIDKIFFANRRGQHSTGPRSATGEDWRRTVDGLIDNTLKRIGLDRASPEGRRIVNAKSLEYRDFARAHKLATPKTYFILSRVLPYHGEWTVNCYNCAPFVMTSANDDLVVSSIIWTDTFEPTSMSVWLRLASAPGVVLDIGGYTGVYALVAASRNRENAIFCFEPLACNHRRIAANFALNDLPRLTLVPVAVGESDGEVTLNVFADGDFLTSGSSLVNEGKQASKRCDMVQCVAVDSFVKERGLSRISLVKIDVEGAELNVLHGMQGVIERDHPDILIEVLSDKVGASLTEFLGGHGYRFFEIHEGTDAVRPVDRLTGAGDLENLNRLVTTKSAEQLSADFGIKVEPRTTT